MSKITILKHYRCFTPEEYSAECEITCHKKYQNVNKVVFRLPYKILNNQVVFAKKQQSKG
jgi:hypothetical protein